MASPISTAAARMLRTRWLVRAPIWLYRHGLGWVLGGRMLMLEHRGRSSGLPRYVCLEAVERPAPDIVVVVSGFGEGSQWYRNVKADPRCRVSTGRRTSVPAVARVMSTEESADALERYQRAHPGAWRRLKGAIEEATGSEVGVLPMVELTLTG